MHNQDVLRRATPHTTPRAATSATVSREDAVAERLGNLMLWLIPAIAFLAAILR